MTTSNPQQQPEQQPEQASALTLWNEQIAALADPAQADGAINEIYAGLMDLHSHLTAIGQAEQAAKAAEAYNMALALYNSHQQHSVVVAGGAAAIQETEAARQKAVTELKQLLKAIEDGDEEHPALADYADEIRSNEAEFVETMIFDDLDIHQTEQVMEAWGFEYDQAASVLMTVFGNMTLTQEQETLFRAFAASLIDEEDGDAGD